MAAGDPSAQAAPKGMLEQRLGDIDRDREADVLDAIATRHVDPDHQTVGRHECPPKFPRFRAPSVWSSPSYVRTVASGPPLLAWGPFGTEWSTRNGRILRVRREVLGMRTHGETRRRVIRFRVVASGNRWAAGRGEGTWLSVTSCGNDYDKAFRVVTHDGREGTFDSYECAIHRFAPTCGHCGCRIIGHGVESDGQMFCCADCARHVGIACADCARHVGIADVADRAPSD